LGGGVWTLLSGQIIRTVLRCALLFMSNKWRPSFHYNFQESKSFLAFGIKIALSRSLYYIEEKSDCFFAGRAWKANVLGLYTFALQLAMIPTDKIVTTINAVAFPAFSKLQNDKEAFNKLYLNISKVTTLIVFPLFVAGFLLGEQLIHLVLNPKWYPMIPVFKLLCLAQIFTSLIAMNSHAHSSQGRPGWNVYYNIVMIMFMPVSFYFAVQHGLQAIVIPWLTTYIVIGIGWVMISIRKFGIPLGRYCTNLSKPFLGTLLMAAAILFVGKYCPLAPFAPVRQPIVILSLSVILGATAYAAYFWFFDRGFIMNMKSLFSRSKE
jgi:O-antigen/teichoic acid export membrane protein